MNEEIANFKIEGLYPQAINIIENKKNFKKNFGFELNLGLIKFNYGVKEK